MVYRLLSWGVVGGAYHNIQNASCASAKFTLNNGISAKFKNYSKLLLSR